MHSFTALEFKAGKDNVTTSSPGLFGCKKIYFQTPFYVGQPATVLASVGHTVKSQTPRNGAAVWVEGVKGSEFTICVLEFSQGSNKTLVNCSGELGRVERNALWILDGYFILKLLDNWNRMQEDRFSAG